MRNYNIYDYRIQRWVGFKDYFVKMLYFHDCDPTYPALNYVCDRTEANLEQRYWIAWIFGTNYCVPTTWYIFNEFPDYENVDVNRMERWWKIHKKDTLFQSDRAKVKNFDLFVKCFQSYRELIGPNQQQAFANFLNIKDLKQRYKAVYNFTGKLYYFGRFTLFNYLEALNELTDLKMEPDELNFRAAESSRNGMCYVCEKDNWVTLHHKKSQDDIDYNYLQTALDTMIHELQREGMPVTYWNIETVLCAYKKLFWQDRYLGYYIDRMQEEIDTLQKRVTVGVNWQILWDFRSEFFHPFFLGEKHGWLGVRDRLKDIFMRSGILHQSLPDIDSYWRKVDFPSIGDVYGENWKEVPITSNNVVQKLTIQHWNEEKVKIPKTGLGRWI